MPALKFAKRLSAVAAATILLAGCASNPAPVTNYSFGGNGQPAASAPAAQSAPAASGAVKTFGLGNHANGSVAAGGYTVARGDTLYSIAFAHGMDVRDLAALNGIASPYVIHPGQVLRLSPAAGAAPATGVATAGGATGAPVTPRPVAPTSAPPGAPVFGPVTTQTLTANGVAPAAAASVAAAPAASVAMAPTPAPAATSMAPMPESPSSAESPVSVPAAGATRTVAGVAWQWPAVGKVIGGFTSGKGGDGAGLDIAGNAGDPVRATAAGTVVYSGDGLIGYGELIIIKHNDTYLSAYGHNSKRLVKEGQHVDAGQEIALMGASGAPRVELHFEIRKDGKPVDPLGYLPRK